MDGCPCCTDDTVARRLLDVPLPEAPARDLAHYVSKALTTWGTIADYKYFLPEILTRAVAGRDDYLLETTLSKLAYARFETWLEEERQAVREVLSAALREATRDGDEFIAETLAEAGARVPGLELTGDAAQKADRSGG